LAKVRQRALVAGVTLGATAVFAANAEAATYPVNSTADDGTGTCNPSPGECTLRDAVTSASANGTPGTPDTVDLSAVSGTIALDPTKGVIGIGDPGDLNINGPGPGTLTVSGENATGIFQIDPGAAAVSISGLTLTAGASTGNGGAIDAASATDAPLTLTNVTISGNTATDRGGGVYSERALKISGSTITGNTAGSGGGIASSGKYNSVTIENSTVSGNTAQTGGGIFSAFGAVSITGSHIDTNTATTDNGGGIAAFTGSLSLTGSTVSGNSAQSGGGINSQTKYGTTIDSSTIANNTAHDGGGLAVFGGFGADPSDRNAVLVQDSTISGNQAPNGAGIEIGYDSGATPVTVKTSTISGNQGGSGSVGGGVLIAGPLRNPFDLVNSTVSGNSASDGGGVSLGYAGSGVALLEQGGSIGFDNSTIAANTAATSGGGIYLGQYDAGAGAQSSTAAINSTIVAGNEPSDLFRPPTSTSGGFNDTFSLIENPGNAPLLSSQALITGVDPQLGSLADNGGPTETMLPSNTSPVIDQGKAQAGLTTDQRGEPRTVDNGKTEPPGGDGTDIGAVELAVIPPAPPPPKPPPPPTPPVAKPPVAKPPIVVTTRCKSRRHFVIRLKERRGRIIRSAKVFVHGRRVAVMRRRSDHRLVAVVDLRGLPKGTYRVVIKARLRNGHRARWVRSYRTCSPPLPSSNHLDDPRAL
jgi:CSLREA domain-containing protein